MDFRIKLECLSLVGLHLSLKFVGKVRSARVKHLSGSSREDRLFLPLPTNIGLGLTSLSRTNALAYYENMKITDVKVL